MEKNEVAEIQGLYGPFSLSERVLQKIWLRGDFDSAQLRTASGKSLRIIHPGRWNLLEGPDFLEARLEIDGEARVGDVEVHFYAADWEAHAHGSNPNFARVCLHVVLLPAGGEPTVKTCKGVSPETIYLMPLLERDLEDYAVDDALLELEQVEEAQWMRAFLELPSDARRAKLGQGAAIRWERKLAFAKKRRAGTAWSEACHQYCLEVLGYARNRAPMARLALGYGIEDFAAGTIAVERMLAEQGSNWRLSGLRPANHPKQRLRQYASICRKHPNWPERLRDVLRSFPVADPELSGADFRRAYAVPGLVKRISEEVFSGAIGAKRLNTLICDALLPLAAAEDRPDARVYWLEWPAGDAPEALHRFLKQAQIIDRSQPFSNGQLQGGLQLLIEGA